MDLRLGIGINYGRVRFDLFGITIEDGINSRSPRRYSTYTAVGDQMSIAQRLCSVANKPLTTLDYVYRSEKLPHSRLTAPIIASRTTTYWAREYLKQKDISGDPLESYRTDFELKGKGHPLPAYEIWPEYLDTTKLLSCIEDPYDGLSYRSLKNELENKTDLKKVIKHFKVGLDAIYGG